MKLELLYEEYRVLDVMKFVMAIVVVAIHTRPELSFSSLFIRNFFETVYSIAVPFFFMASGFLLFRKISLPLTAEGELRIKSYLKRMCKLYGLWTIVYLPLTIYGFYLSGISPLKAFVLFLRNIFLVGENYMSWPLWYLLALIVAVSIVYVLLKLNVPRGWIVSISIGMALIGIGLDYCKENSIVDWITDIYFINQTNLASLSRFRTENPTQKTESVSCLNRAEGGCEKSERSVINKVNPLA